MLVSDIPPEPQWLPVDPAGIPEELKSLKRWILWQARWQPPTKNGPGRWTKIPKSVKGTETGTTLQGTKGQNWEITWGLFDEAFKAYSTPYMRQNRHIRGIGFVCTGTPYSLVDYDHCIHDGKIDPDVAAWVKDSASWAELSVSGTGIHNFVKGKKSAAQTLAKNRKKMDVEIYSEGRYFTVTGHHISGTPMVVAEGQAFLDKLYAHVFETSPLPKTRSSPCPPPAHPEPARGTPEKQTVPPPEGGTPETFPAALEDRIKNMRWQWQLFLDVANPLSIDALKQLSCVEGWRYFKGLFAEAHANGIAREELYPLLAQTQPDFDPADAEKRVKEHGGEKNYIGKTLKRETMEKYFPIPVLRQMLPQKTFSDCVEDADTIKDRVGTLSPESNDVEVNAVLSVLPSLSPLLRERYLKQIARKAGATIPTMKDQYKELVEHSHQDEDPEGEGEMKPDCPFTPEQIRNAETFGGIDMRAHPLKWMKNVLDLMHKGDTNEKLVVALLFQGIYLGHTFSLAVRGDTQSGKTHLVKSALRLVRKEDYDMKVSATGAYLRRKLQDVTFKLFFLCEMAGINKEDGDAVNIIKMLSSDDRGGSVGLCDKNGDQWEPVDLPMPADLSFVTTYAGGEIDSQLESRMWVVECNMAKAHNVEVNDFLLLPEDEKAANEQTVDVCCAAWQEIMGVTYSDVAALAVYIPFESLIEKMFPVRNNPTPRDINKFLFLLKIITKIHYALAPASREIVEIDGRSYIVSEPADLYHASILGQGIIQKRMEHLTETDIKILKIFGDLKVEQADAPQTFHKSKKGLFPESDVGKTGDSECGWTPKDIFMRGEFPSPQYVYRRMKSLYWEAYLIATSLGKAGRVLRYDLDEDMAGSRKRGLDYLGVKSETEDRTRDFLKSHGIGKELAEEYTL